MTEHHQQTFGNGSDLTFVMFLVASNYEDTSHSMTNQAKLLGAEGPLFMIFQRWDHGHPLAEAQNLRSAWSYCWRRGMGQGNLEAVEEHVNEC